jgi:hypothetical protein
MARVRSTARVSREGEETEVTETAPIFEVMKQSGLVVTEETTDEGTHGAEAEQTVAEEENIDEDEEDYSILIPTKPSRLDFEKSTVSEADMTRPMCNMQLGSPCQLAGVEFRVVAEQISTRDLVQEYLANRTYPTSSGWGMSKMKGTKKKHELVRLSYRFKFEKQFK